MNKLFWLPFIISHGVQFPQNLTIIRNLKLNPRKWHQIYLIVFSHKLGTIMTHHLWASKWHCPWIHSNLTLKPSISTKRSSVIIFLHIPSCVRVICVLTLMFPSPCVCVWWRKRDADGWFGPCALQPGRHQVEFAAECSALEPGSLLEIYSPPYSRASAWALRQHWSRQEVWAFSKTHSLPAPQPVQCTLISLVLLKRLGLCIIVLTPNSQKNIVFDHRSCQKKLAAGVE